MIEAILLSSILNLYQTKEKPFFPFEEKKEFRIERYGLREEEIIVKPYFMSMERIEFDREKTKYPKLNKMKGGKNGRIE
jgi:hypothetical protein